MPVSKFYLLRELGLFPLEV